MECGSTRRDNHLRQGHTSIAAAMHRDISVLGAKVVAPDVSSKRKVEIPTRESWDSRSVTSGEGVQSWYTAGSNSSNMGWSVAGVYR